MQRMQFAATRSASANRRRRSCTNDAGNAPRTRQRRCNACKRRRKSSSATRQSNRCKAAKSYDSKGSHWAPLGPRDYTVARAARSAPAPDRASIMHGMLGLHWRARRASMVRHHAEAMRRRAGECDVVQRECQRSAGARPRRRTHPPSPRAVTRLDISAGQRQRKVCAGAQSNGGAKVCTGAQGTGCNACIGVRGNGEADMQRRRKATPAPI